MQPRLVPFRAEHLVLIARRDLDFAFRAEDAWQKEVRGPSYTAMEDDLILGCAGIIVQWPGFGTAWAVFSKDMFRYPVWITRVVKRVLSDATLGLRLRRIETVVDADNESYQRWAEVLGFVKESERRVRSYTPSGGSVYRYERVRDF